jgi:branched-chain amino acid transport system substrate-binding protein
VVKPAPATIKLGAVVPVTGKFGSGGAQVKTGYEIAVQHINQAGGVFVKEFNKNIPLELKVLDDESDPTKTVSRLETLNAEGVTAYLGGFGSALHAAAAAIADKNKVPYLGVAFALWDVHQRGYKYLFSPFIKSPDIAREVFKMLNAQIPEGERPTKVAIFRLKTDWGIELANLFQQEAGKYGYEVVVLQDYAMGTKDYSPLIQAAKAAGAEALMVNPTPPDGMAMMKQIKELDYNFKFYYFIRAADVPAWGKTLGSAGDYAVISAGWHNSVPFPGIKELNASHQKKKGRPADPMVGPAYAAVQILADAIQRAGTLDRAKIREALAATDMMTVTGPVKFAADGTAVGLPWVATQWQKGKQVLIWPKEYAQAPFAYPAAKWSER